MKRTAESTVTTEYMHKHWGGIVGRVRYSGERYVVTSHGKPAVAIVPVTDLQIDGEDEEWGSLDA